MPHKATARRLSFAAALAVVVGTALTGGTGALGGLTPARAATDWVAFDVLAAADGLRATTFVPGGPLNDRVFDAGVPRSQARIDGLGSSTAFASTAYPDELVLNVPGIAAGASRQNVPGYPGITYSSHPTQPESNVDAGAAAMLARSDAASSAAEARVGTLGTLATGLQTDVDVRRDSRGTLHARSASAVEGLTVGPLTIARLTSTVEVSRTPGAALAPVVSTRVIGARVGGQEVAITADGLQAAEPARSRLAAANITIRWLHRVDAGDSVTAPGIEITAELPASLTGSGTSTVTLSLGRATVSVSGRSGDVASDVAGDLADLTSGPLDFAAPVVSAGGDAASAAEAAALASAFTAAGSPGTANSAAFGAQPVARLLAETWPAEPYVVFFAATTVLACAAMALHIWGIRSPWTS